jgi:hypothetical protein
MCKKNFEMRWNALELLDRRQVDGCDKVLVHWACSWITQEDYRSGRYGKVAQLVQKRTVDAVEWVLVQWAASWEPVGSVDQGLLEDFAVAPDAVPAVNCDDSGPEDGAGEAQSAAEGGGAAEPKKAVKRRRVARRGW